MENFSNPFIKQINWIYGLLLILGIALSGTVYFRGEKIRLATEKLVSQDIPAFALFQQFHTQLSEQERYLYEYYATTDENHFLQGYQRARSLTQELLGKLEVKFPANESLELALINIDQINRIAGEFNRNMLSNSSDWDLARSHLARISQLRRNTLNTVNDLTRITEQRVAASQSGIQQGLWEVRVFVVIYGLLTILIVVIGGRGFKAYLSATATSHRLSLFPKRNPNSIVSLNEHNEIIFNNPASERMLQKLALDRRQPRALLSKDLPIHQAEILEGKLNFKRYEYPISDATFECELHWLSDEKQWDIHLIDVTSRKVAEQELQFQAFHHRETGLENEYQLKRILDQKTADDDEFILALIEIRHFNQLLSSRGYNMTRMLVNELAQLLESMNTETELPSLSLYHVGDNNFAILIEQTGCETIARQITERVKQTLYHKSFHCQHQLELDYGFVCYPQHGQDTDTLLKHTRIALEHAIHAEHGCHVMYHSDLGKKVEYEQTMISNIRQAIDGKHFELYFQPQLCIQTDSIVGLEVLIRWQLEEKWISPADFIPLAEKSGLIVPLGDWILKTACEKACTFIQQGYEEIVVAVNISPKQFNRSDFVKTVQDTLARTGLPAANLELEITEGVIMYNENETINTLHQLKELGVMLSIDDFGTGYSSLSYLKQFPVDKLKIDQSFIRHIQQDNADRSIVRTVIDLGNNLALKLIAEGVEESEQLLLLQQMGCHEIQGYYFSRPLPESQLMEFLRSQQKQTA